ncbi:riboflavin biosynthesis protein RibF [Evansella tamaricis]|uniref:Riboflavin biosynthesis protein n=1 Tax=Evansella tamaricis TaxID=2069301 RepID=A0ABS6JLG0_9BACI|nr:riboflavin biosynthesis protein RibF [Evansella tamaricis]MBU9714507.1 riboflavin biosynthesis protein RibF [Evansella tamaricis]
MKTIRIKHPHAKIDFPEMVIALGFFDGVHKGHKEVILTAKKEAMKRQLKCGVMTFFPHPKEVLRKEKKVNYLTSLNKKEELMFQLEIDYLIIIEFNEDFSDLNPQQFVDRYLIDFNIKHVVAGFDYSYGRLGKGTMETLPFHSRNKLTYTIVGKVEENGEKISSTSIRKALSVGNLDKVTNFLGRYYETDGVVVEGEQRGRQIGFPTANIASTNQTFIPDNGVYIVKIQINNQWLPAVCNVGYKPTFHDKNKMDLTIEVHILNYSKDIYGQKVKIQWIQKMRNEVKFESVNDLVNQLKKDVFNAKYFFQTSE